MDALSLPNPPQEPTDIFSLSDQVLSDRLHFIEEIGFGNWGSVWLCFPKTSSSTRPQDQPQKLAVKLVHRSKTPTTAARVRSLWNEMKIVRTLKNDPHPSIVPFHSFIITPSYALITMAYLPTLVPVEVDELKSRHWFHSLLSAVQFLHARGVVHNDIKPANILLSDKNVPVLVDFGFAEKYDLESSTAFHSNLSYGTPEYLAPERGRGLPHDTRKSDVWSLGVTFFEILIGRTPFEYSDGEQFTSKEDLEKYWARTLKGKWVGTWKMSKGIEKLLHRMVAPNADLRYTASQAMNDEYWSLRKTSSTTHHRRSASYTSSVVFEKDMKKLLNMTPSSRWTEENMDTPPGLTSSSRILRDDMPSPHPTLPKSKSQPKVASVKTAVRKRGPAPAMDLSPIKASTPATALMFTAAKENIQSFNMLATSVNATKPRRPFGNASGKENIPAATKPIAGVGVTAKRRAACLVDVTSTQRNNNNSANQVNVGVRARGKQSNSVRLRMKEWERERERLREMETLEDLRFGSGEQPAAKESKDGDIHIRRARSKILDKENIPDVAKAPVVAATTGPLPNITPMSPFTQAFTEAADTHAKKESSRNLFKHSIKKSIDKTWQFYKSSTFGQATGISASNSCSMDVSRDSSESQRSQTRDASIEESVAPEVNSSLPVIQQAEQNRRLAADSRLDRMTIWMRNVEKVVEDAKLNFASASTQDIPLPPLPVAPLSRHDATHRRPSRLPRKVLAASQIFADDNSQTTVDSSAPTSVTSKNTETTIPSTDVSITPKITISTTRSTGQIIVPEIVTPSRQRRATVSTRSPEPKDTNVETIDIGAESPSKRKEKSKSHGNLFQKHIASISVLEAELSKPITSITPEPSLRLSQVLDRSLFIASPTPPSSQLSANVEDTQSLQNSPMPDDDLTSSPCHVEPYPARRMATSLDIPVLDTPSQRRIEGVYDRFLMATSGVKRVGKGYQSENAGCASSNASSKSRSQRSLYSARKPMPPPVSSDDRPSLAVDELGQVSNIASSLESSAVKDDIHTTVAIVRRALKAIVPSKRSPRLIV